MSTQIFKVIGYVLRGRGFHETRTIFLLFFRFKEPNHLTFDKTRPFKSDLFSLSLISEAEPFEQITTSGDKLLLFSDNHYCISPS